MRLEIECHKCGEAGPIWMSCLGCRSNEKDPYHVLDRYLVVDGPIQHVLYLARWNRISSRQAMELLRDLRNGKIGPDGFPPHSVTADEYPECDHLFQEGAEAARCVNCGTPSQVEMIEKMVSLDVKGKDCRIISAPNLGDMEAVVFESGKPMRNEQDGGMETIDAKTVREMAQRHGWRIEEIEDGEVQAWVRIDNVMIGGAISGTITIPDPLKKPAGDLKEGEVFIWEEIKVCVIGLPHKYADEDDGKWYVDVVLAIADPEHNRFDETIHDPETIGVDVIVEIPNE